MADYANRTEGDRNRIEEKDTMSTEQQERPRKPYSVKGFARATGHSPRQVRKAIALKEIRTVIFAGNELIPPSEADRINQAGGGVPAQRPNETTPTAA